MNWLAWVFAASVFSIVGIHEPVSAQSAKNNTVTVAPSISDLSVDPGGTVSGKVTIANQGLKQFLLTVKSAPYTVSDISYDPSFEQLPGRTPTHEWVTLHKFGEGVLDPGKYIDVGFDVAVPQTTKPGGYSFVILVQTSLTDQSAKGVNVRNQVAHIVYINVNGAVEKNISLEGPITPLVSLFGEQPIEYRAKNDGGTNEKIKVDTTIKDMFGREISSGSLDRYVLPGTQRKLLHYWSTNNIFGVYNVHSTKAYTGQTDTSSRWIIVMSPWFLLFFLIVMLIVLWRWARRSGTIPRKASR